MAAWRQVLELSIEAEDLAQLQSISCSRTESAGRVERARILLAYIAGLSFSAVAHKLGLHHQTAQRCVERAFVQGPLAALHDRPRSGRRRSITPEARTWARALACRKAKEFGYPHELWTSRLLAKHIREHAMEQGYPCLAKLAQGTLCKILNHEEVKPHRMRYYLEKRDPDFDEKMSNVLDLYREVEELKAQSALAEGEPPAVAIISYDEKPGIQAIGFTAPDLPPIPGKYPSFAREFEYRRLGTVSLLAGWDLVTGEIHGLVRDRQRSLEFIEFLKDLDKSYPSSTRLKILLDNHSAHTSKETRAWLAEQPEGRFEFTFTPKHGSWLNLIEVFFSKMSRSVLRQIRVNSLQELKDRVNAALEFFNREPVVPTWSYKMDAKAA